MTRLQWGRGFESTETVRVRPALIRMDELQWGRGFESTETGELAVFAGDLRPRFNGAVDLNPRKQDDSDASQPLSRSLQWGRGFESTETLAASA